jgi:5'-phosphate synthase pdxT subunit
MARIGVLALQGDFEAHARVLAGLGSKAVEVRRVADLRGLDGLVMPGGESTTLLHLMADEPWFPALKGFHRDGGALMGTCAGAILLAREVVGPAQESLGLLDATIARNAFGRQVDSFETTLDAPRLGGAIEAVFIRAPRFKALGPSVETLATYGGEPVLVREGRVLAMTFHPELTRDATLHAHFLTMAETAALTGRTS